MHSAFITSLLPLPALLLSQRDENSDNIRLFRLLVRLKTTKLLVDEPRNRVVWRCVLSTRPSTTHEFPADTPAAERVKRIEIDIGKTRSGGGLGRKDAVCSEVDDVAVEVEGQRRVTSMIEVVRRGK